MRAYILAVTLALFSGCASEMSRRLFKQLGEWSTADDPKLRDALAKLGEAIPRLREARSLFARALETPGGLRTRPTAHPPPRLDSSTNTTRRVAIPSSRKWVQ